MIKVATHPEARIKREWTSEKYESENDYVCISALGAPSIDIIQG